MIDEILTNLCKNTQADYGYEKLVPEETDKAKDQIYKAVMEAVPKKMERNKDNGVSRWMDGTDTWGLEYALKFNTGVDMHNQAVEEMTQLDDSKNTGKLWQDGYNKGFKAGKQTTKNQKKPLEAVSGSCLPSTEVESLFSDANNNLQPNYSTKTPPNTENTNDILDEILDKLVLQACDYEAGKDVDLDAKTNEALRQIQALVEQERLESWLYGAETMIELMTAPPTPYTARRIFEIKDKIAKLRGESNG